MRKRVAFVGGSGAFQPEIACHKIKSFWILLASKVSERIVLFIFFILFDQAKRINQNYFFVLSKASRWDKL